MTRSPDSLVPSDSGQPEPEKRDDKALNCWQGGEANLWRSASSQTQAGYSHVVDVDLKSYGGRGFRVSGFRVSETPETDAIHVAAQEGVPTYPGSGARSSAAVPQ